MSSFLLSGLLLTGCGTQDATGQWVDVAPVTTAAPAQQSAADNNNSNDNGGSDNGSVDNGSDSSDTGDGEDVGWTDEVL